MKKPIYLLSFLLLTAQFCLLPLFGQNTESKITIELLKVGSDKVPSSLNFDFPFKVTNNSEEDIYFPKPISASDWPNFFVLFTDPGDECIVTEMPIDDSPRKPDTFLKIPSKSSKEFKINGSQLYPGLWCGYKAEDVITVTLAYKPKAEYLKPEYWTNHYYLSNEHKEAYKEIIPYLPSEEIKSQSIEVIIE